MRTAFFREATRGMPTLEIMWRVFGGVDSLATLARFCGDQPSTTIRKPATCCVSAGLDDLVGVRTHVNRAICPSVSVFVFLPEACLCDRLEAALPVAESLASRSSLKYFPGELWDQVGVKLPPEP